MAAPNPETSSTLQQGTIATTRNRYRALYDYTPTDPDFLTFRKGDIVALLDRFNKELWYGHLDGHRGLFPPTYFIKLPAATDPTSLLLATPVALVKRVKALHDSTASRPGDLAFCKDDIIEVLGRSVHGDAWTGSVHGRTGIFPVNLVEKSQGPTTTSTEERLFINDAIEDPLRPNLTNEIFPFLAEDKWMGLTTKYPEQAMRLLSKAIAQHWPLWHSLLVKPAVPVRNPETGAIDTFQYSEPSTGLDHTQLLQTKNRFFEMANELQISVEETDGIDGSCGRHGLRKLKWLKGHVSKLVVSEQFLADIGQVLWSGDAFALALHSLRLCTVLLHELAHAAAFANARHPGSEPVLEFGANGHIGLKEPSASEIGFEIEDRIFGGAIHRLVETNNTYTVVNQGTEEHVHASLTMSDWPNPLTVANYQDKKGEWGTVHVRGSLKSWFCLWHVPAEWIVELFQDDHWSTISPNDQNAMKMPKIIGIPQINERFDDLEGATARAETLLAELPHGLQWASGLTISNFERNLQSEARVPKALLEGRFVTPSLVQTSWAKPTTESLLKTFGERLKALMPKNSSVAAMY